ncbi:tetratricopeptide repeat protein [Gaetbulibacter aestuarii]|uniref:Tetratricopeptide repeat protein n=1 Tax=Gaetbulibacter aestuarii TaxID=1502358 RepID=A0ABW7MXQ6_9FLAO
MNKKSIIFILLTALFMGLQVTFAQVDFNKKPTDDLGNVQDAFQESFFEALKQRAIENYDKAIEALLKCEDIDRRSAVVYYELGLNYIQLMNFGAAEDALKKAVRLEPENKWYNDALYGYYLEQKDYDKAIKTLKDIVEYYPDYKEDLAGLYVKVEKFDKALDILDELDAQFGITESRDMMRNAIYKATGRKDEQIENLQERLENNPDDEANYLKLIYRYSANNQEEKAFETAKELLNVHPQSQLVHLALYKFYLKYNQPEKAIESMKIVVKSPQIEPEAKLKVLTDFVNFVKTHPEYEKDLVEATAVVGNTNNVSTLLELGQYYLKTNDKTKALKNFEAAMALDPDNLRVLKNTLLLYLDFKKYENAAEKSSEAMEKFPAQPIFYLINGVASNALNKPKQALEALDMGIDFVVDNPKMKRDFYSEMSKAYTLLNNTAKAKAFSDKAAQIPESN